MADALTIAERRGLGLAAVMARAGADEAVLGARLGAVPPSGPRTAPAGDLLLVGVGPGAWLAVLEGGAPAVEALEAELAGSASVSDQSAGYVVFRLSGEGARRLLQAGAFIDLDADAFPAGSAAVTAIAHMGVILWAADPAPAFDLAVFRSLAGSFRDWLAETAAGLGLAISWTS